MRQVFRSGFRLHRVSEEDEETEKLTVKGETLVEIISRDEEPEAKERE